MQDINKELLDVIDELPKILNEAKKTIQVDVKASEIAEATLKQISSLIGDNANLNSHEEVANALEELKSVATQDKEVIAYGKAISIVMDNTYDFLDEVASSWRLRIMRRLSSRVRRREQEINNILKLASIYLVVRRIKQDILDKYEITEPKK